MAFDIEGARKEGYSETEIADYLASQSKFDVQGARKEGYSDADIIQHLSAKAPKPQAPAQPTPKQETTFLGGLQNLGRGVVRGGQDLLEGGTQLVSHGALAAANAVAPNNSITQQLARGVTAFDKRVTDNEAQYQKDTEGSVMAGVGRVGSNVATAFIPGVGVQKALTAATLPGKIATGAFAGSKAAMLQPVTDAEDGGYAGSKALQVATGAALGSAVPAVSRVGREVLAKTGDNPLGRLANESLIADRSAKVFGKSETPAADAQVILDLAKLKNDPIRFRNATSNSAQVGRQESNNIGADYVKEVTTLLKQAGVKDTDVNRILAKKSVTMDDINSLKGTPEGDAAAAALLMKFRGDAMSKPAPASSLLAPVRRGLDYVTPKAFAPIKDALLGGRGTGEAMIDKMTSPRTVAAAERMVKDQGSPVQDIGILRSAVEKQQSATALANATRQAERQAAADAAEQLRIRNLELGVRSNPGFTADNLKITGGVRGTLQYYARLADSKELAKGLRIIEKTDPYLSKQLDLMKQNRTDRNNLNIDILTGVTDRLKLLRDQGVLKPYQKK